MKKLFCKIKNFFGMPTDKISPSIFIGIVLLVIFIGKFINPTLMVVIGIIGLLLMLLFLIVSIIKHERFSLISIYLVICILCILLIITYYNISKGNNFYIIGLIYPIILLFCFITAYYHVKKTGNIEKIKLMKIGLVLGIPSSLFFLVIFLYILFFKK